MNDLVVVEKPAQWDRLKSLVIDSVSSPITKRVYNVALDEFLRWFVGWSVSGSQFQDRLSFTELGWLSQTE